MSDERKSSVVLIVGSVGMIITMIFHPHGRTGPEGVDHLVRVTVATHSLALLSTPLVFLGALGISRWLKGPDRLAVAAVALFGFATVAVMNAAVLNGLVAPNVIRQLVGESGDARDRWQALMRYGFEMNQAYARVYAVASGLAIALWSAAMLKNRKGGTGVAIYGCILAALTVGGIGSGLLTPDVHGFLLLVFGQAIWFLVMAGGMWSAGTKEVTT